LTRRSLTALAALALAATGCSTAAPPPSATGSATPLETPVSTQPTAQPSTPAAQPSPGVSLDPALSDAGVVATVTLPDDHRGGRTGTHVIIGQRAAASDCSTSFDGTEFTAVAWVDDATDGQLARLSVTIPVEQLPTDGGGAAADIDGRVSFDFVSESGFGTLYTGDASEADSGSSTIDVVRTGAVLVFSFEGVTWDDVAFFGQAACRID
jgi:hypothetical protein